MALAYDEESHSVWVDDSGVIACGLLDKHACLNLAKDAEAIKVNLTDAATGGMVIPIRKTFIPLWLWAVFAGLAALWASNRGE